MDTTTSTKTEFTTRPFVRSHGHEPRGRAGLNGWAFQQTRGSAGFSDDLFGPVLWFGSDGTLAAAKRELRAAGHRGLFAVLP